MRDSVSEFCLYGGIVRLVNFPQHLEQAGQLLLRPGGNEMPGFLCTFSVQACIFFLHNQPRSKKTLSE